MKATKKGGFAKVKFPEPSPSSNAQIMTHLINSKWSDCFLYVLNIVIEYFNSVYSKKYRDGKT